jgi:tRNA(Leu) C34 or U34 (ribose-2'-O)-methylase TrmL
MNEGAVRSLNLSTTVGIAVYEVFRQRRHGAAP